VLGELTRLVLVIVNKTQIDMLQGLIGLLCFILSVEIANKTLILHHTVNLCPEEVSGSLVWSQVTGSRDEATCAQKRL
jgi:hypothetical protein